MTLLSRVRMWAKEAPSSHVVATTVVALMLATAVIVATVPDRQDANALRAAGPRPPAPGVPTTSATPADGDATATTAAAGPAATATTAPTATGGVEAPTTTSPGTSPPSPQSETTGPDAPATTAPPDTSPPDTMPAEPPPPPPPPEPLTASDRGITPETIKLGFLVAQLGGLDATGFALGMRTDQEQAIKAFVDRVNNDGGVLGRQITYVIERADPLSESSGRRACIAMADDHKVFAVIDASAVLGVTQLCFAEKETIHVTTAGATMSEEFFWRSAGYNVSPASSGSRAVQNWVPFMMDEGFLVPGQGKLGILSAECPPDPDVMDNELKPLLQHNGIDFVEARVSCDTGQAQQQVPGAVLQLRQAGVDRVFLGVIFVTAQNFMQSAQLQNWRPPYSVSDYWGLSRDFSAKNFPPDQFDGAKAPTFTTTGEEASGLERRQPVTRCSQILEEAGLPGIDSPTDSDAEVTAFCGNLDLFLAALSTSPANPSRLDWIDAIQRLGEYPVYYSDLAVYGPGKFNGGDSYAMNEWRRECSCWMRLTPHRPAHA